jgi:hypothetical protein
LMMKSSLLPVVSYIGFLLHHTVPPFAQFQFASSMARSPLPTVPCGRLCAPTMIGTSKTSPTDTADSVGTAIKSNFEVVSPCAHAWHDTTAAHKTAINFPMTHLLSLFRSREV